MANGQTAGATGELVHWSGLVTDAFEPNTIRELNLSLVTAGLPGVPTAPGKEGSLTIVVSEPLPWDANIKHTDMDI
jgi:hypothetical protein